MIMLAAAASAAPCISLHCGPVVATDDGPVQGRRSGSVVVYHGIPFAAPPTGAMRWTLPSRPEPWNTTLQATKRHSCPQLDIVKGEMLGQEDCLFVSLFVPDSCTPEQPCAVMQWIYGGAWVLGSAYEFGDYDARALAQTYGVIVVAANYRIDSLGWIALKELADDTGAFGNYGLHDQRSAMQWTQRNVARFGGDPHRVTIFGESAGGFSVCQHLVSPASNHLFSAAIMQSGDCDGPWMVFPAQPAQAFGDAFATAIGCAPGRDRLACLRALPIEDVLMPYDKEWHCPPANATGAQPPNPWCNSSSAAPSAWRSRLASRAAALEAELTSARRRSRGSRWPIIKPPMAPVVGFAAVVDGSARGLPNVPYRMLLAGEINTSPSGAPLAVILGTNRDEMALFIATFPVVVPGVQLPARPSDLSTMAQHLAAYHSNWGAAEAQRILDAYPRHQYASVEMQLMRAGTDLCFACGTRDAARALAAAGVPTYLYSFEFESADYRDPASLLCTLRFELGCGVYHGRDINYVFQHASDSRGQAIAATIGGYWTNLAKTGTPNGGDLVRWPRYAAEAGYQHIVLAESVGAVRDDYRNATCNFWDSMPKEAPYADA